MMLKLFSPKLFVSYSRQNEAFVTMLAQHLRLRKFEVFVDTKNIDPGDNFVSKLTEEVRRCDGLVAVVSDTYVNSRWAQAELYQALTSKKIVIPIQLSEGAIDCLDLPLRRLLENIQYMTTPETGASDELISGLADRLADVRVRRRSSVLSRAAGLIFLVAILLGGTWWVVQDLNSLEQANLRTALVERIKNSTVAFQQDRIEEMADSVPNDDVVLGTMLAMSRDPALTAAARLNASLLGGALRTGQSEYRWYARGLSLERLAFQQAHFVKVSFLDSSWQSVRIEDSVFGNVYWGDVDSVSLANVQFRNSEIIGSEFAGTKAISVEFINTKFVGSVVDTTHFSKVKFLSLESQTEGNPVITPKYSKFDKSLLISHREPPPPGVLDLSMPGDDIVFDDVYFVDCRLEGWFRPEWFRNSNFQRCELPESLSKELLEHSGNQVVDY